MNIEEIICDKVESSGVHKPTILLNGRYLMWQGKQVHIDTGYTADGRSHIKYFVRQYNNETNRSEEIVLSSQTFVITRAIGGDFLFDLRLSVAQDMKNAKIEVNAEYSVVIIESSYYQIGQRLQNAEANATVSVGGITISAEEANVLRRVFFENALVNYRDVVYSTTSNKFAKHLIVHNKFYGIRPNAFVPVFIDLDWLYNPLKNTELAIEQTRMYKIALDKGRFIENHGVSAYFLTHLEICQAFGMSHFARFSPSLWFNMFIGLLQPNNSNFPNKLSKLVLWNSEQRPPAELKKTYNLTEFANVLEKYKDTLNAELQQYVTVDSLEAYITKEAGAIRTIGATYLDDRANTRVYKLCEYYAEAKLLY